MSNAIKVLVVEDERELGEEICDGLQAAGHAAVWLASARDALGVIRVTPPSILVVDRVLGDEDGLTLVKTIRDEGNPLPVLVVSGLSTIDDRILGLKAGGDDYLIKPFDVRELVARVEALLRRSGGARLTRLQAGPLEMDLVDRTVTCEGRPIELLPREFKLLEYFMRRQGQIVTRAMLLEDVWNFRFTAQTNVVDVHIGNLRRKLNGDNPRRFIVNVRSAGFRLDADA